MKQIMTVRGPIAPDELGTTSMHDHILVNSGFYKQLFDKEAATSCPVDLAEPVKMHNLSYLHHGYQVYSDDNWDLTAPDFMRTEVQYFKERGGQAILETSAPGIRRNIKGLKGISEKTGVHIIASTGLYIEESWPQKFRRMATENFVAFLKQEINCGIENSGIKPGHIKTAILHGTDLEFTYLKAAIHVANETGLLVTAHTGSTTTDEKRRKFLHGFLKEGLNPEKLLFCHAQFTFMPTDMQTLISDPQSWKLHLDWAREVLDSGANICIDLFGSPYDLEVFGRFDIPEMVKMAGLLALINAGYSSQIVIGNDVYQKIMTRSCGGHGYCRILDFVIPTLRKMAVDSSHIQKITVQNPARLLQYDS